MSNLMIKECKVKILKRMLLFEEKYNNIGYITSFSQHESFLTASNIAIWKVVRRGIITPEEVRTAIYQLEKAKLLEIINRSNIKLNESGRAIARQIRSMVYTAVSDDLLEGSTIVQDKQSIINNTTCPKCHNIIKPNSKFCAFCGYEIIEKKGKNCPYCGEKINPGSKFCANCGASLE